MVSKLRMIWKQTVGPEELGTLGGRRNWMLRNATGEVVLHFDDDDYYAPHYVPLSSLDHSLTQKSCAA